MDVYTLRILINIFAYLPAGFIVGRKVGTKGWLYATVTPLFVQFGEAIAVLFLVRLADPGRYLLTTALAALFAGSIGGALGQASKRSTSPDAP